MSRNNDVFQVLVTKGNQAVLGAGNTVEDLGDGQIGLFDSNTNVSVDGSTPTKEFYLAVGVHKNGVLDSINTSAGSTGIQTKNMNAYTFRPHTPGRPQIVEVSGYQGKCDTDFAIKLEFRNQKVYRLQGFVPFNHTFAIHTACCEGCEECPTGDCNEVTMKMVENINSHPRKLVTAQMAIPGGTLEVTTGSSSASNATVTINGNAITVALGASDTPTQVATKIANAINTDGTYSATVTLANVAIVGGIAVYSPGTTGSEATFVSQSVPIDSIDEIPEGTCSSILLTSNPLAIEEFCSINPAYYNPRETVMIASLLDGFACNGSVATIQEAAFEEGSGYDVQQREYKAGGWNGRPGPYRVSESTLLYSKGFMYFANANENYDRIALEYQHEAQGAWLEYKNELATEINIPATNTVTRNSLMTALDNLFTPYGFDELADDALDANVNPAVVETTSEKDDYELDGIS